MKRGEGVWVVAEQQLGRLDGSIYALVKEGKRLSGQLQTELSVVIIGYRIQELGRQLSKLDVDTVLAIDGPEYQYPDEELYTDAIYRAVTGYAPEVLLFSATFLGKILAPRVASRLGTGLTADCTGLEIDAESRLLVMTRPAFEGNMLATIVCEKKRPQMATVHPRLEEPILNTGADAAIVNALYTAGVGQRVRVSASPLQGANTKGARQADVVIGVGKGIGGRENWWLVEKLAARLGAEIGVTRALADEGWCGSACQIGQTGLHIKPKAYIACGISGAVQHMAGVQPSELLIAINIQEDSDVFHYADIGIIADLKVFLPALLKRLDEEASV